MKMLDLMGCDPSWVNNKDKVKEIQYYSELAGLKKKNIKWGRRDPEEVEEIIKMRKEGYTLEEIAHSVLMQRETVRRILYENNVVLHKKDITILRRMNKLNKNKTEVKCNG